MAKVAVIGATGNVGARLVAELAARSHRVTAIARNPRAAAPQITPAAGDVRDPAGLSRLIAGHDAVVSAVRFRDTDPAALIGAVRDSGVSRYLVVGGAGSLEVAPGQRLVDQPDFPAAYRDEALRGAAFLDALRRVADLDWSFLSPSALIEAGERTGRFRLGRDALLVGETGSRISYEDYAVALVDEIERPAHLRQRFTVGY
ncbi:NAD(P)-dependent oxidoreductase [Methylobacterium platani]|uniref:3-beta hydroxysteroid dehydrogenase n=2 Tax=Methylobacterium platani TaxID=427683 RepID=A0A179SB88_9HYPH|nr:NAD(P)-dependent oxidoreductase [Methylobacterium platani]KMO19833.1 3-beta hydroxysteroid dehydrogenase [Methylobacterium platani JCM 14648]OAS24156.1 3-beta hydroxysteroid dehydrogenase [Methylobacterium platani]